MLGEINKCIDRRKKCLENFNTPTHIIERVIIFINLEFSRNLNYVNKLTLNMPGMFRLLL